jgi:hypothetical protein
VPTTAAQRRGERATHRLDAEKVWVMREPGGTEDSHESSMTSLAAAQDPDPSSSRPSLGMTSTRRPPGAQGLSLDLVLGDRHDSRGFPAPLRPPAD